MSDLTSSIPIAIPIPIDNPIHWLLSPSTTSSTRLDRPLSQLPQLVQQDGPDETLLAHVAKETDLAESIYVIGGFDFLLAVAQLAGQA